MVETALRVRDEHEPGDCLCMAIQAYDSEGTMPMTMNVKPFSIFCIETLGKKDDRMTAFLGWGKA